MPNAPPRTRITLSDAERAELSPLARSRSLPAALALPARIVLDCEGPDTASSGAAARLGISRATVTSGAAAMRHRVAGLYDELRAGRPRTVDDERVAELINKTAAH